MRFGALLMLLVLLTVTVLPSFAAGQPAKYSSTSNSGERDVICTTLDGTTAAGYYTGSYTYEALSAQSSGTLLQSLRTLMTNTHKKQSSYDDCHYKADMTDCENNNGKVSLIYTSYEATMSEWNGWNREHVWPKSLGGFDKTGAGSDLHHIRPSDAVVNSTRNNDKYGNVNGGKEVKGSNPATGYVGGYSGGGYFEPLDNVKGDVARICLYVYVRWGATYSKSSNITNVFQSVDVLLEWCALDPVDTWEMGRNEVVYAIQGNRNVFIDYPEYAWLLFGRSIPSDMTTPSGKASGGNGGSQGGGTDSCTHETTVVKDKADATCSANGYTGDTYCTKCNKKLSSGTTILKNDNHSFGAWETSADGKSASRTCSLCKKVEQRSLVNPATCPHEATYVKDEREGTCMELGYSGDVYCKDCDKLLVSGTNLPMGNHSYGEPEVIVEATDKKAGLARLVCSTCGVENVIEWDPTPAPKINSTPIIIGASIGGGVIILGAVFIIIRRKFI